MSGRSRPEMYSSKARIRASVSGHYEPLPTSFGLIIQNNSRRNRNRSAVFGIDQGIHDPQRDRQIRAAAPEGALRLIEEMRRGRVRHGIDPSLPQDLPRQTCAVYFVNSFSAKSEKLFPVFGSGIPLFRNVTWKALQRSNEN